MKGLALFLGALSLFLTGCQPPPSLPTPEPPTSGPSAPAQESPAHSAPDISDPGGYVLGRLEDCLNGDRWWVRFWIFPGSGPVSVEMPGAEYGEALRGLFSSLDWEMTTYPEPDYDADDPDSYPVAPPGTYGIQIIPGYPDPDYNALITIHSNDPMIRLDTYSEEEGRGSLLFRAEGAEELCGAIADLWPGPEADLGRVRVQPEKTQWASARAYMEAVFAKLSVDGHITGSRIDSLEVIPAETDPEQAGPPYLLFKVTFSVKPSRPELSYWAERLDGNGWAQYSFKISTSWDAADGAYGLSWYEYLNA